LLEAVRRLSVWGWVAASVLGSASPAVSAEPWVLCYSPDIGGGDLSKYRLVVLDADHFPSLSPLVERGIPRLAYLSLTQMGKGRAEFADAVRAGVMLEEHPVWTDAHYLDFRRPEWKSLVLDRLVPQALERGFTGLFLDTLDDAEFLESQDPVRYAGMREAAVQLVRAIRERYPRAVLMVNRGYALMPQLATSIDILLGESVVGSFDTTTKAYRRQSDGDVEWQVAKLHQAKALNPRLELFTLDYWDPADRDGLRAIYREQRARGFAPYVSTPQLDRVIAEPQ
jgi:polysaccharide biosynthesis protein PelA